MKTLLLLTSLIFSPMPHASAAKIKKTLQLVASESTYTVAQKASAPHSGELKFLGDFGKSMDLQFGSDSQSMRFNFKSWKQTFNFAPGSPNLMVSGILKIGKKKQKFKGEWFFEATDSGVVVLENKGVDPFKLKFTLPVK
jgi:hypothetical protein